MSFIEIDPQPEKEIMSDLLYTPWICRKKKLHYVIEAPNAGGVHVAEVKHISRPDGSTSELEANAIAATPDLLAACLEVANGYSTHGSEMARAAIIKATGEKA